MSSVDKPSRARAEDADGIVLPQLARPPSSGSLSTKRPSAPKKGATTAAVGAGAEDADDGMRTKPLWLCCSLSRLLARPPSFAKYLLFPRCT